MEAIREMIQIKAGGRAMKFWERMLKTEGKERRRENGLQVERRIFKTKLLELIRNN